MAEAQLSVLFYIRGTTGELCIYSILYGVGC